MYYMFLTNTINVHLSSPQKYIEGAALTHNSGAVVFSHNNKQSTLWHCSQDGTIQAKYIEEAPIL